jgi:hypothetical protein
MARRPVAVEILISVARGFRYAPHHPSPEAFMDRRLVTAFAAVLLLPLPLDAQERSTAVPAQLEESWTRFADSWDRGDVAALAPQLSTEFTLLTPDGSYVGRSVLDDAGLRAGVGTRYRPARFTADGGRIIESGRAYLAFPTVAEAAGEEQPMCDPDDGLGLRPASYLREWVRSTDGAWQVKSVILY